jgi:hypothetical protein
MTKISELHRRWSKDRGYKGGYDALGEEFDLARALIEARTAAGLSQSQLAKKMKTSQSYIARIEGGKAATGHGRYPLVAGHLLHQGWTARTSSAGLLHPACAARFRRT